MPPENQTPSDQTPPTPTNNNPLNPNNSPQVPEKSSLGSKLGGFFKGGASTKAKAIIIGTVVAVGAGAGAYYGLYLPNTPERVLASTIDNTLKLEQVSGNGTASFSTSEGFISEGSIDYTIQSDSPSNSFKADIEIDINGVKIPFETRYVEENLFIKVGDLSSLRSFAALSDPSYGSLIDAYANLLSDQWIEIDKNTLKATTGGEDKCGLFEGRTKATDDDRKQILAVYNENKFIDIKSTSSDTINGQNVTKFDLGLNKEQAKQFGEKLKETDYMKKIKECLGGSNADAEVSADELGKADVSLIVWIDKSKKQLVKFEIKSKDDSGEFTLDFTFNDDAIDIQKPDGAKSLQEILAGSLGTPSAPSASSDFDFTY